METIYEKLDKLLNDLLHNGSDVKSAERKIEQTFADSFRNEENIDQAYFQEFRTDIYLKESNGLSISLVSGKGDIIGNIHSNDGTRISLHDARTNETHVLYFNNEFQRQTVTELVNKLPNIMSRENFITEWDTKRTNPFYLYTMEPKVIRLNPELVNPILEHLWQKATFKHNAEYDYYMISPYGGLDVKVHPIAEHFLNLISKFNDIPEINDAGNQYMLSKQEGIAFLTEAIEELKKKICYVENKETYRNIYELEHQLDPLLFYMHNDESFDIIANEKKEDIFQYQKAVTALEALQDKNYTIFDRLKKLPKMEYESLVEQVQIRKENLDDVLKRELLVNQAHKELEKQLDDIQREIKEIMDKNNLPPLYIDHPIYSFETFDELMYPYTKNYNTNVATLVRYKAILDLGTNSLQKDPIYGVKKNIEVAKEAETKTKKIANKSIEKNINRV